MAKTIRPDGSLDPAEDFEDDGASFRVRREIYLNARAKPRGIWSKPRNQKEAISQGLKFTLTLWLTLAAIVGGFLLAGIIDCIIQ